MIEIIIAIGVIYLIAKDQVGKIVYRVTEGSVVRWGYDGVTVHIDVQLDNNSAVPILVDGFIGGLYYRGDKIADIGLVQPVRAHAGETETIRLGAKILYGAAGTAIIEAARSGIKSGIANIRGSLQIGGKSIPVNTSVNLAEW